MEAMALIIAFGSGVGIGMVAFLCINPQAAENKKLKEHIKTLEAKLLVRGGGQDG